MNSHMTADYAGEQMIASQIVRALGQPFILVPIGILATMHLKAHENASASTVLNVMRNLGGAFGIALVATLSDNLARVHLAHIKETLPAVSAQAYQYINDTSLLLQSAGSDAVSANSQAYALLAQNMSQQAYIQAYNDVFFIMACFLSIAVVAVLSIRKPAASNAADAPNEMH